MKTSVRPAGCVSSWLPDTTDKYGGIQTTTRASPIDAEFTTFSGSKRMSALELTKRMFSGLRSVCVSWLSCRTGHTHIHIEREREKERERERERKRKRERESKMTLCWLHISALTYNNWCQPHLHILCYCCEPPWLGSLHVYGNRHFETYYKDVG